MLGPDDRATLKDLDAREDLGEFSADPGAPDSVGAEIAARLPR